MSPTFEMLHLARCESESTLSSHQVELTLRGEHNVELELQVPKGDGQLRALVTMHFTATAFDKDETKPDMKAAADYVAEFIYPEHAEADAIKADFDTRAHQRHLVMQAFPAAVVEFRALLGAMGLPGAMVPLTPP